MQGKTPLCRNFQSGSCRYGDRCKFVHAAQQQPKSNVFGSGTGGGSHQQQTRNPFGFGVQNNVQSKGANEAGSKQNQFKPFENKWTRSSAAGGGSSARQPDNQSQSSNHTCTDPEACKRIMREDFENEKPLWKLTCYGHWKNYPCDIVGDISYEELRAAAYDDAKRGLSMQSIVERERNMLSSKLIEFENLLRNPYTSRPNSTLASGQSPFPMASPVSSSVAPQNSAPPAFSSFSQLGSSHNTGPPAPSVNAFGQSPSANAFGQSPSANAFGQSPSGNAPGQSPSANAFGQPPSANAFGQALSANAFGQTPSVNAFGQAPSTNTFGQTPSTNTSGQAPAANAFGQTPSANAFGQAPAANAFGQTPSANAFGQAPAANTFGQPPLANAFGQGPTANAFGQAPSANAFGQAPSANAFGQAPSANAFGQAPSANAFGQAPSVNAFGQTSAMSNSTPFGSLGFGNNGITGAKNNPLSTSALPTGNTSSTSIQSTNNQQRENVSGDASIWLKEKWTRGEIPEEAPPDAYVF